MIGAAALVLLSAGFAGQAAAAESDKSALPDPAAHKAAQDGKKFEAGRWVLPDGSPTYDVNRDEANPDIVKKVDWMTYSGWRRYHAECHVCHGPNAEGSSFAPALPLSSFRSWPPARSVTSRVRSTSCLLSAITRTSCATLTIFTFTCGRARRMRCRAVD